MMQGQMTVNRLKLPDALAEAIASGKWQSAKESPSLTEVFNREQPCEPCFYGEESLERENQSWVLESDPAYLGKPSLESPPGDIDPNQSVLIGDLGMDRLIALDYRGSHESPRVVYLTGDENARWVEASSNVASLLHSLGVS